MPAMPEPCCGPASSIGTAHVSRPAPSVGGIPTSARPRHCAFAQQAQSSVRITMKLAAHAVMDGRRVLKGRHHFEFAPNPFDLRYLHRRAEGQKGGLPRRAIRRARRHQLTGGSANPDARPSVLPVKSRSCTSALRRGGRFSAAVGRFCPEPPRKLLRGELRVGSHPAEWENKWVIVRGWTHELGSK